MLIKDVAAIGEASINFLDESDDIIDRMVELPLRKPCKIFREKGIETVMSSANKTNIIGDGEKVIEKEDIVNNLFETHMFYDAGKGYAWIMLNFDTLSKENKDLLFEMESRKDIDGGKRIWFVHPGEMIGNIEYGLRIGRFSYDYLRMCLPESDIPCGIEVDEDLIEFEKRHVTLMYPWTDSSTQAVFLRMPINDSTTVAEVENYFVEFAEMFYNQRYVDDNRMGRKGK